MNKWLLVIACTVLSPLTTHADDRMQLLQVTCRPEYDFFSVRSMQLEYGLSYRKSGEEKTQVLKSDPNDPAVQRNGEKQGFYTSKTVMEKPVKCELEGRTISVEVANYEKYDGRSGCTYSPRFDVQVSVDGDHIYSFPAFGENSQCMPNENHQVSIRGEELQDCKLPNLFSVGDMSCSNIERPKLLKQRR